MAFAAGVKRVKRGEYEPVRRVSIVALVDQNPHRFDEDNLLKITLDALKRANLIVDDSAEWVRWEKPVILVGPVGTIITIEDVE